MKEHKLGIKVIAMVFALLLVSCLMPGKADAASSSEIKKQIDELEDQNADLKAQIKEIRSQYKANENEIQDMISRKDVIDQEISLLNSQVDNINAQISAYGQLIADKQEDLEDAQARLAELSEKNRERIRAMEENGTLSYWSVLFKASSFSDLLDRLNMIEEIAAADRRRIQEMSDAAAAVAEAKQTLSDEKAGLEATKAELASAQLVMEEKREESNELLAALVAEAERLDNDFFNYEQKTEELIAELGAAQIEYENAKYQEWLATSETTTEPTEPPTDSSDEDDGDDSDDDYSAPPSGGDWIIPCNYIYLSSAFGWREPPVEGASTFHSGVDLAADEGTPIWAARGGTVYRAGYNEYNGYYVGVDHGDGFSTVYLHMTHYVVDVGDYVSQGETLGYMGSTGVSSGPHLHLTMYYNGSPVNPAEYISFY